MKEANKPGVGVELSNCRSLFLGWLVSGRRKEQEATVAAARAAQSGGGAGGEGGEGGEQHLATEIPQEYNIRPSFLGGDMFGLSDNEQIRRKPVRTEALRAGGRRVAAPQGMMPRIDDAPAAPRAVPPPPTIGHNAGGGAVGAGGGGGGSAGISPGAGGVRQRSGKKGRR